MNSYVKSVCSYILCANSDRLAGTGSQRLSHCATFIMPVSTLHIFLYILCASSGLRAGTGSLRVGAEFLGVHYPVKKVLIPGPTWPTHRAIFTKAGMSVSEYRYFHAPTKGLDIQVRCITLQKCHQSICPPQGT